MKKTWIIAANNSYVRLFTLEKGANLNELEALVNPDARLHERDLVTDRPGESAYGNYPMQSENSAKKMVMKHFAKHVASTLERFKNEGLIDRVFIAASPAFLGELRQEFSPSFLQLLQGEVDKDITYQTPKEILGYFPIGL